MSDGIGVTQQVWVLIFALPWGPTVMEENLSPPRPSVRGMFPSHLVTLSAAQGGGGMSRGKACFLPLLPRGNLRYDMVTATALGSSSGAAAD